MRLKIGAWETKPTLFWSENSCRVAGCIDVHIIEKIDYKQKIIRDMDKKISKLKLEWLKLQMNRCKDETSTERNLLDEAFPDPRLLRGRSSPSSCKLCLKLQSGPLSHFPLLIKSKQTPLIYCSLASISCWKWHLSPRGHDPDETNLKHIFSPSPAPCLCRFCETSYLQYCESERLSLDLFAASFSPVVVYGDNVVFVDFIPISVAVIIAAGVGEIAWINFWNGMFKNQVTDAHVENLSNRRWMK